MNKEQKTKASKFLSLVLRHQPEAAYITLDSSGWTATDALLTGCAKAGIQLTHEELCIVVNTNEKRRFEFNADGTLIRASQGHSVKVELEYTPVVPPEKLYHGTVEKFLPQIQLEGLRPMQRHHVHLSEEIEQARIVGARRGKPVILTVLSGEMHRRGHIFRRSANDVWLAEAVAPEFILFPGA